MDYIGEPAPYQKHLVELSAKNDSLALLWDAGVGKTYATIHAMRLDFNTIGRIKKSLILSPIVTLWNWKEEFAKFSKFSDKCHVIDGSGAKRLHQLQELVDQNCIIILNWEALRTEAIHSLLRDKFQPEIIVGDELHMIKSYKSKTAKLAVELADGVRERKGKVFGMTGTAILNSIQDIYMQYRFLDGGKLFGRNFFAFRNIYMYDSLGSVPNAKFPKYVPRQEMFSELTVKIYSIATKVSKKEALPYLPELVEIKRYVKLGTEQAKAYKEMKRDFITWFNENSAVVAQLALTKILRLQQIVCGHVTDEHGKEHIFAENPRVDVLQDLLLELTAEHKVIVWHTFRADSEIIGKVCRNNNINHVFINGEQSLKEKKEAMDAFNNDENCRVLVGNRRAGGIGINLIAADYSIVYSRNFSLGEEEQSKARNYRRGSERHEKIIKIDLVAKDTIDEDLLLAIQNKSDIAGTILTKIKE